MKLRWHALILFTGFLFISLGMQAQNRQRLSMDLNWKFKLGDPANAQRPNFNDHSWRTLDVPHDWSIEGKFQKDAPTGGSGGFLPTGIGWYRKHFAMDKALNNQEAWIQFDGIYMNSDVWINGHHLGRHPYGYTSFYYDITPYLKKGENVLAVRVDNSKQPNTRWYSGSGIYRNVWLNIHRPLHINHWGVYVTTPVATADSGIVKVETHLTNDEKTVQEAQLVSILTDSRGKEVVRTSQPFSTVSRGKQTINQTLSVTNPDRWSPGHPTLYTLHSQVVLDGKIIDEVTTPVGIREIAYKTNDGFYLNGKHIKMHGVNIHHAAGAVGAAVPVGVWKRRLKELKKMGVNAIRTSHNPPAPEFLDLCDQMGLLVMDEAFDVWEIGKRKYDYHLYFDEWGDKDLKSMVLRDRNHPSVVLWSAGNEIREQTSEDGPKMLHHLVDIVHKLDPSRPVTSGNDEIADDRHPTKKAFLEQLDIVGYNYTDRWHKRRELYYTPDKLAHPDWKMIGTESPNIYSVRGNYSLGDSTGVPQPNYNFNMIREEQLWKFVAMHDYVIGDFMWTGIDYLGESWWPYKNASSGSLDLAGFKKDSYYFYQSQWTDKPVLHLFPHWNWPDKRKGQIIPVLAYTNCDTVDLYLNGKFYGEKRIQFPRQGTSGGWNKYAQPRVMPTTADLHLSWDLPYEPGEIKAVGKKEGKTIVRIIKTTGKPAKLAVSVDHDTLQANGRDVAHLRVEVVDDEGNVVPYADNEISFQITGQGKLIGLGNGDPKDHTSPKANHRKAFHGLTLAIIQSTRKTGAIRMTIQSKGLPSKVVRLTTIPDHDDITNFEESSYAGK